MIDVLVNEGISERNFALPSGFSERLALREARYRIQPGFTLKTPRLRDLQYGALDRMTGHTPLLRFDLKNGSTVWAKMESENPGSESHYDRAALATWKELQLKRDILRPGDSVLEVTSGSAGRSFAYFCKALDNKAFVVTPRGEDLPSARRRDIVGLGATLIDADEFSDEKHGPVAKAINKFRRIRRSLIRDEGYKRTTFDMFGAVVEVFEHPVSGDRIVVTNHAESDITPIAFGEIAREALEQIPNGTTIDAFVGTLGNGSTIKGITDVLRQSNPDLYVIGTEDKLAPVHFVNFYGEQEFFRRFGHAPTYKKHDTSGASNSGYNPPFIVKMIERGEIDEISLMQKEWEKLRDTYNGRSYLRYDDINTLGHTSAQNLRRGLQYAQEHPNTNTLVLFYDKGDQYADWPPKTGMDYLSWHTHNMIGDRNPIPFRDFHDMGDEIEISRIKRRNIGKWMDSKGMVVPGSIKEI